MKTKKIPMRMCVACKELKEKKEMLRIVKNNEGRIFLDFSGKASGRGAYICNNPDCVKKLRKQHILNKVFSCQVDDDICRQIEEEYFGKQD
ncbi:MAG: YlxR family protein [Clostridia bacterium]|nr:YlxR family protein [Clostridia bacterium]